MLHIPPIHFVYPAEKLGRFATGEITLRRIEENPGCFRTGEETWVLQTYLQLRARGCPVTIGPRFEPGRICLTHCDLLSIKAAPLRSYVVAAQADRGRPMICRQVVVQNPLMVRPGDPWTHFVPIWPQPGLIGRDPARGSRMETLAYKGITANLWIEFRTPEFRRRLERLGVRLELDEVDNPNQASKDATSWHDYSRCDAVIAARDLTEYDAGLKPASKLTNAWRAGVPALLGPEPAFCALRRGELDYLEVRSAADALEAVRRLKQEPGLHQAMAANGLRRGAEHNADAVAARWQEVLGGPIAEDYRRWRAGMPWRVAWSIPQFAVNAVRHRRNRAAHTRNVVLGRRILSG